MVRLNKNSPISGRKPNSEYLSWKKIWPGRN
jgi:hypothetical protein